MFSKLVKLVAKRNQFREQHRLATSEYDVLVVLCEDRFDDFVYGFVVALRVPRCERCIAVAAAQVAAARPNENTGRPREEAFAL